MGRGCLTLLAFLVPIGLGAVLPPAPMLALYAFALLALLGQSLGQRRFGPRFGLPGLLSLPPATAIGAALAIGKSLAATHGWLLGVLLALLAGLLLLLPLGWIGRRFEPRDPLPPLPRAAPSSVPLQASRDAPDDWRPLGETGLKVLTVAAGERGMGGPPHTFIHTLSVALCLSGEEWGLSDDGRWWVVGGQEEEAIHVVDLPARLLFRGPWRAGLVARLCSGPTSAARLAQLGFERVRAYVCRSDGLWWPQGEPVPPTEAAFGPAAAGLRRVALIERERILDVGDALLYAQQPDWRIESEAGPLPLILSHGALEAVLWREDGRAALFPASETLEGGVPPAGWYLWHARGEGRWLDFGRTWERGIPGLGAARPTALREEGVEIAHPVHPFPGVSFPARASAAVLDEHFTPGPLPWFCRVDEQGWPVFEEVEASVPLSGLRTLQDPADAAGLQPLLARHPAGPCLVFEPMGPPVDPREQRPYRLRHERLVLEGISPVPRWLDGAGRFVVLQGVLGRALASQLHLVDLASGRVSTLRRPVAELRLRAVHQGQIEWTELCGQQPAKDLPEPLRPLEGPPEHNAWNRRQAAPGRLLVLRGRRAQLDAGAGCLRLLPPWVECCAPVSPLQPGDVEYRPPSAPPVLLFGARDRWQDAWPREQEPRLLGGLLTAEGHAVGGVAQGMIGSADGRWLLFARHREGLPARFHHGPAIEDWEIALLDRRQHRLHARPGEHFGGLPFFLAFEDDRIVFETAGQPWWRPGMPRQRREWSLEALLRRLDAMPMVEAPGRGLWRLAGDPVPARAWQAVRAAWQAGEDWLG